MNLHAVNAILMDALDLELAGCSLLEESSKGVHVADQGLCHSSLT